jgi:uncharacterized protein YcbX
VSADATVAWLSVAPVKSLRLQSMDHLRLDRFGARGDRRFAIVDEHGHLVNAKRLPALLQVIADVTGSRLTLRFPDGGEAVGEPGRGAAATMVAYGEDRPVHVVDGPWSQALSEWAGTHLRLVEPDEGDGVDRRREAGVSLLSVASVQWLSRAAGRDGIDARRFRMTVGVDGVEAFEEERWMERLVDVGSAAVRVHGNIGRCSVTTLDPDHGVVDLQTLHVLKRNRDDVASTEPLPLGVWAEVIEPGDIRIGDPVRLRAPAP